MLQLPCNGIWLCGYPTLINKPPVCQSVGGIDHHRCLQLRSLYLALQLLSQHSDGLPADLLDPITLPF